MNELKIRRFLEITPGLISWLIIFFLVGLLVFRPILAAIFLIVYLIFWALRLLYMSSLLVMAYQRMMSKRNTDWLGLCKEVKSDKDFKKIVHLVLYTVYKEPKQVIEESLSVLKDANYPLDQMVVILAGEERAEGSLSKLEDIKKKFARYFRHVIITVHPQDTEGEIPCKGANATYAAKAARDYFEKEGVDFSNVIVSCFDADTCPDKNYFSCLTYHFLASPKRHHMSFQPLPVYANNIYVVPAFARIIELGSTLWQLIETMRYEKFVTFSSHSMSFKTLVDIGYWPVDLVSDDSLIFWKCFLKFNGKYTTCSLEVPVYMDIAVGKGFIDTVRVQYKQKRRWAWGVEVFVFFGMGLLENKHIWRRLAARKLFQILDNHISWATWSIIISFITPAALFWSRMAHAESLIFFNLSYINGVIFNSLAFILVLFMLISRTFIPPRPKNISPFIHVSFVLQWLFIPFVSAVLGSLPALDAQTRLMFRKTLGFYPTPKQRK